MFLSVRVGRIEAADGGTLFLDEIGEMPLALQSKLLRFVESGELQRVGDNETVKVDVRVIAATHRPLAQHAHEGGFRADLYYRLAVFLIRTPSLSEHLGDLPLLVEHFLERMGRDQPVKRLASLALAKLAAHDWPGNVRELENSMERACALSSGPVIHLGDLPTQLQRQGLEAQRTVAEANGVAQPGEQAVKTLAELEREAILGAIRTLNGDKLQAAKLLGIGKTTLYRKLKEYGIADPLHED
jgi:DNA-binding NtrC family response regulator